MLALGVVIKVASGSLSLFGLRFSYKITATIVVLVIFASAVIAVLAWHKYKSILDALVVSRLEVTAGHLQNGIQAPLRLGLSLSDVRTMQEQIDRTLGQDRMITAIHVFETAPEPRMVYGAGQDVADSGAVPPAWVDAAHAGAGGRFWRSVAESGQVLGVTLVDRLEQPMGGIAVVYSTAYVDTRIAAMTTALGDYVIIASGAAAGLGFLAVQILFRPVSRRLKWLARFAGSSGDAAAAGPRPAGSGDALSAAMEQEYGRFDASVREAEIALGDLEALVEQTDARSRAS